MSGNQLNKYRHCTNSTGIIAENVITCDFNHWIWKFGWSFIYIGHSRQLLIQKTPSFLVLKGNKALNNSVMHFYISLFFKCTHFFNFDFTNTIYLKNYSIRLYEKFMKICWYLLEIYFQSSSGNLFLISSINVGIHMSCFCIYLRLWLSGCFLLRKTTFFVHTCTPQP